MLTAQRLVDSGITESVPDRDHTPPNGNGLDVCRGGGFRACHLVKCSMENMELGMKVRQTLDASGRLQLCLLDARLHHTDKVECSLNTIRTLRLAVKFLGPGWQNEAATTDHGDQEKHDDKRRSCLRWTPSARLLDTKI